jgi:DNA-binding FadR family transcriptional regulator
MAYAPIQTKSVNKIIFDRLVGLIRSGAVAAGDKIPSEKELMKRFGVGRSSVREALHALVTLRMLEVRPGKGYFVAADLPDVPTDLLADLVSREKEYLNLMEAREALEVAIARFAIKRATPADFEGMLAIFEDIEEAAGAGRDITAFTGRIHLALAEATHNPVFVRLLEALMPLWPMEIMRRTISVEEHLRLHKALIDGLREGDEVKMVLLMREHLSITREYYLGGAIREATQDSSAH